MNNLSAMAIFAKVVEAKSFTAAAARLGVTKSLVSREIGRLEDRLGARLLNRSTRRLSVTETGAAFYERCARVVAEAEEAERAVTNLQSEPRGTLMLNAPVSFGALHVAPAISEYLARFPEARIDMTLNDRFVDLVEEGFDLAIRIAVLTDSSLIARRLAPSRRAVCASYAYLERHGAPRVPDDLLHHNCMSYAYMAIEDQWQLIEDGQSRAIPVSGNFRANNGDALREAALAGLGLAILPTFIVGRDIQEGRLASVRFARNEEFAESRDAIAEGDVIALIPPVAGG